MQPVSNLCSSFRSGPSLSKPLSKKELLQRQLSEGDMDLDDVAARSTTATPGPSDDDMPSKLPTRASGTVQSCLEHAMHHERLIQGP